MARRDLQAVLAVQAGQLPADLLLEERVLLAPLPLRFPAPDVVPGRCVKVSKLILNVVKDVFLVYF